MAVFRPQQTNLAGGYRDIMAGLETQAGLERERGKIKAKPLEDLQGFAQNIAEQAIVASIGNHFMNLNKPKFTKKDADQMLDELDIAPQSPAGKSIYSMVGQNKDKIQLMKDIKRQTMVDLAKNKVLSKIDKTLTPEEELNIASATADQLPKVMMRMVAMKHMTPEQQRAMQLAPEIAGKEYAKTVFDKGSVDQLKSQSVDQLKSQYVQEYVSGALDAPTQENQRKKEIIEAMFGDDEHYERALDMIKASGVGLGKEPRTIFQMWEMLVNAMKTAVLRDKLPKSSKESDRVVKALKIAESGFISRELDYEDALKQLEKGIKDTEVLEKAKKTLKLIWERTRK